MIQVAARAPMSMGSDFRKLAEDAWEVFVYRIRTSGLHPEWLYVATPVYVGDRLFAGLSTILKSTASGSQEMWDVEFLGRECLTKEWMRFAVEASRLFFRAFLVLSKKECSVFDLGRFDDQTTTGIVKNYLFIPAFGPQNTHTTIHSLLKDLKTKTQELPGVLTEFLGANPSSTGPFSFLCSSANPCTASNRSKSYILLTNRIDLSKLTLKEYFHLISPFVCREDGAKDRTAGEFAKWLQFSTGAEVRKALGENVQRLMYNGELESFDSKVSPYLLPLKKRLKSKSSLLAMDAHVLIACPIPSMSEVPGILRRQDTPSALTLRTRLFERAFSGQLAPSELRLISCTNLEPTPFLAELLPTYLSVPSILNAWENAVNAFECRTYFGLYAMLPFPLFCALQAPAIDPKLNYENLETLGDSILKFVVSLHLFISSNDTEAEMSAKKDLIVGNDNLRKKCVETGLIFFCQAIPLRPKYFVPPGLSMAPLSSDSKEDPNLAAFWPVHSFGQKKTADFVEGLIGAAFEPDFTLKEPLKVIAKLGILSNYDFGTYKNAFEERVLLKNDLILALFDAKASIVPEVTSASLTRLCHSLPFGQKPADGRPISPDTPFLSSQELYTQIFDRRSTNFQRLEFFGDAVLELYTVANTYSLLEALGRPVSPQILHNAKLALLTTFQFSRFAVQLGLHHLITGLSPQKEQEVADYVTQYDPEAPFNPCIVKKDAKKSSIYSSLELEDAFEAFVGGVFLGGGWETVHTFLGAFLPAHILYFCLHHEKMTLDPKSLIFKHFARRKIRCVSEKTFEQGKHVVLLKVYPGGEEIVIGKGVASDEASAAKMADMQALIAVFGKKRVTTLR